MTIFVTCCHISYLRVFDMRVPVSHVQQTTSLPRFFVPTARETQTHRHMFTLLSGWRHDHSSFIDTHRSMVQPLSWNSTLTSYYSTDYQTHSTNGKPTGAGPNGKWELTILRNDSTFEDGILRVDRWNFWCKRRIQSLGFRLDSWPTVKNRVTVVPIFFDVELHLYVRSGMQASLW
jgi:hypothetical protein